MKDLHLYNVEKFKNEFIDNRHEYIASVILWIITENSSHVENDLDHIARYIRNNISKDVIIHVILDDLGIWMINELSGEFRFHIDPA